MKSRKVIIFVAILLICTVLAAFLHLTSREEIPENALKITANEKDIYVDIDKLSYTQVTGVRVNGKGEEIPVDEQGISLKDILTQENIADYEKVTVISDDSYTAEVTIDEVNEEGKVYLVTDEGLRLLVFGDSNSKRSVSNVVQIVIE